MTNNVKNGTPTHGPSLCDTCFRSLVVKGYRESEKVVICQATRPEKQVRFPVRECSIYEDRGRQTLRQMEEVAWTLAPRGSKRQAGFIAPGEKKEGDGDFEFMLDDKAQRLERKNEMFSFALTSRVLCRTTQENPPVPGGDFPVFALLCLAHIALRVAIVIFRDRRTRKGGGPKMIKLNIPRAAPAPLQLRSPRPCRSARRALSRTSCGVIWPVKKLSPAATLFLRATSSSRCATARTTSRNVNAATRKLHARTRCVPRTSNYRQRISASQLPHVTAVGREGT
jgi:hypothetical protein